MNRSVHACSRVFLLLLILSLLPACSLGTAAERVVAIGDVHGAYEEFVSILQAAGLIGKDLSWSGGKSILVQTGDVLDRGPRSRPALDLLMELTEKAPAQGGEVRSLLGNHEIMVMIGDLRYVSEAEYRSFATPDSEAIRQKELESYIKYRKQRASRTGNRAPVMGEAEKQGWLASHPPGFFEFREAFAPRGKYGRWLRSRDGVTQIGEMIFLHGGISPQLSMRKVEDINGRLRRELVQVDELWGRLCNRGLLWHYLDLEEAQAEAMAEWKSRESMGGVSDPDLQTFLSISKLTIMSSEGPLWYRGFAQIPEQELASKLDQVLKRFKIRHMIIGHTVSPSKRIASRFDGRVFMIDTGMLGPYFQGRASALEINDGHFKGIYVGEPAQEFAANAAAKTQ